MALARARSAQRARIDAVAAFVALAAVTLALSGPARAATPGAPAFPSFKLSAVRAVPLASQAATRFSVSVSDVPRGEEPAFTWYLSLSGEATGARACDDALVAGGERLSASEWAWPSQGASFVWYHGVPGSYSADRSYGCTQSRLGVGGYPGTITVVAENEYEHCKAIFSGLPPGEATGVGPAASCGFGGFTLGPGAVPVPAGLLALYHETASQLRSLLERQQRGELSGRGAFLRALTPVLARLDSAYATLFAPLWGCNFAGLFSPAVSASAEAQGLSLELGRGASNDAGPLAHALASLHSAVVACARSPGHEGGPPASTLSALAKLDRSSSALAALAGSASGRGELATSLAALSAGLESALRSFPAVFGIPFHELVERAVADAPAAAAAAPGRAAARSALETLERGAQSTSGELRTEQRHVVAAENAHS